MTDLIDKDKRSLFHAVSSIRMQQDQGPWIVEQAEGVTIRDHDGREIIDCGAGLWCMNIGYGREEIADVAREAIKNLSFYHLFGGASTPPAIELADKVLELFHRDDCCSHLSKVFFGTSGSDANDTNFKLVRYYNNLRGKPEKKKFISRQGAYHGLTYVSTSLTGIEGYHRAFDAPIDDVLHVSCPHYYRFGEPGESEEQFTDRLIAEIAALIEREGADTIAAFIAEPIMGTGGVFTPPAGYFEKLAPLLRQHDILLIADEVITGFGRTGKWFGAHRFGIRPHIVTLAKGLTSAYFPTSASVVSEDIWEVLDQQSETYGPVMHGFTYSGHPVGGAIGLKNIEIMERENLPAAAAERGEYFRDRLRAGVGDHPYVGDIRGEGLMIGVELVADKAAKRFFDPADGAHKIVSAALLNNGVTMRALPWVEVLGVSPPLIISEAEIDRAVAMLARSLDETAPTLARLAAGAA
jgi:L-2,4-diaminobutyrate transaminase